MFLNDNIDLALSYHENSKFLQCSLPFDTRTQYKIYPNAKAVQLKKPDSDLSNHLTYSFLRTLYGRRSTYSFSDKKINLDTLSYLLSLSFGIKCGQGETMKRTYASAGGRYPIEVYLAMLRTEDVQKGVYHYNVYDNSLELIKTGGSEKLVADFYSNQTEIVKENCTCIVLFTMVFERTMQKYGARGYRFIFLDAGHMSQNLYLVSEYLGLGVVALGAGSKNDDDMDDILGLVTSQENAFYGFALGYPS